MEKLRFKDFAWPANPESMSVDFIRPVLFERKLDGTVEFFGLGACCRTLTGKGVFSGPGAYNTFRTLSNMVYDREPGLLQIPIWQDWSAYLTRVTALQKPKENYVEYTFTFREADETGNILNSSEAVLVEKP